jgi:hypothetical protein
MNDYQFEYSKLTDGLLVIFTSILSLIIAIIVVMGIFHVFGREMPIFFCYILVIVPILIFRLFRNKLGRQCNAMLKSDSVEFNFKNDLVRTINFNDLVSYEFRNSKNGPVLTLRSKLDRFCIFAYDYCSNSKPLDSLCKDIISQIEKYQVKNNANIINGGNFLQRKGALRFLIILTIFILITTYISTLDLIESTEIKLIIRLFGGSFLFAFWLAYFSQKRAK